MEKNFEIFDKDIDQNGSYLYTKNLLSAQIATDRQVKEILLRIKKYLPKEDLTILDIGCGDGEYTLALASKLSIKLLIGIDPAQKAIKIAKKKVSPKLKNRVKFKVGNIYRSGKLFKPYQFDVIILQGILHHLDHPKKAISKISDLSKTIIVLEPNGYNPILKIIEKFSPYHIAHKEKSYWPPSLNQWFISCGFKIKEQTFMGIVPYFCPDWLAKLLKKTEPFFENTPFLKNIYCGQNLIVYQKIPKV